MLGWPRIIHSKPQHGHYVQAPSYTKYPADPDEDSRR